MNTAILRQSIRRWWPRAKRPVTVLLVLLVLGLLAYQGLTVDWREVGQAARSLDAAALGLGLLLVFLGHLVYTTYDVLGKALTGHPVPASRVMAISFVSYAFNLNFGPLLGGMALRYRLYIRSGLSAGVITKVMAFSVITNWLGNLGLGGVLLLTGVARLPQSWIASDVLRMVGVGLLLVFTTYLVLAWVHRMDEIAVRGWRIPLPSRRMVFLQAGLSMVHWMLMAGIVYVLLPRDQVSYAMVLSALLLASIAGVISHVPAGLGVLEAVFVAVLGNSLPVGRILAAVLMYRALYYLAPLAVAGVMYAIMEASARRVARSEAGASARQGSSPG